MKYVYLNILFLLIFQSCDYFTIKDKSNDVVARVNTTYLYKNDLKNLLSKGTSPQDSVLIINNYINNWIEQQLLLSKAQLNLENKSAQFERLVKKYKEDLYINSYKEAVVSEYLNTEINDEDIEKFYLENSENFKINEELLKLKYIKIRKDIYDKKMLIKLFKSSKKEDLKSLKSNELSLTAHHLNDSIWIKYSDFLNEVSLFKTVDREKMLKKDVFIQKEDSLSLYLVTIKEVLRRNEIAPKSYITPTIKQMILHQRKLLLLKNIEETLIEDARKNKQFEIY